MVKMFVVFGKVRGKKEGVLRKRSRAGKFVPMTFKMKARAVMEGERFVKGLKKRGMKASFRVGEFMGTGPTFLEPLATKLQRDLVRRFKRRKRGR